MSAFDSNVFIKQTGVNEGKLSPVDLGGRVRLAHGAFAPASAGAAGDTVNLVRLPKGARILPMSVIHFEAGQDADLIVKIGDAADDDRYYAAAKPGANAATITLGANAIGDYVNSDETDIVLTTVDEGLAAGKKIVFDIFFVVD